MNSLATSPIRAVFLARFSVLLLLPCSLLAQGSLTPPGAPAPTMKTLTEVEPRIAVQTLTGDATAQFLITQPGSYYLTGNINGVSGKSAIAVNADNVTLDLCGHALLGVAGAVNGIEIRSAHSQVAISNGSMRDFTSGGIFGLSAKACRVEHLSVQAISAGSGITLGGTGNIVRNCNVSTVATAGIFLSSGISSSVENCVVDTVTGSGPEFGIFAAAVTNSTVIAVTCSGVVDATGMQGSTISNCHVSGVTGSSNGTGIRANSVTGCTVDGIRGTTSIGILAIGGQVSSSAVNAIATGAGDAASSPFGISTESAANCLVIGVGSAASTGSPIGILTKSATNCEVSQVGQTSSAVGAIGFLATTVTGCHATTIRGGSAGNVLGISANLIANSTVETLSQDPPPASSPPCRPTRWWAAVPAALLDPTT